MSRFGATRRAAGFRRVNTATGWLAAGAATLVGVFGFAVASQTAGAKASGAPTPAPAPSSGDTTATAPPLAPDVPSTDPAYQNDPGYQNDQGYQSFQTPDTLPQRTYREPVASSGGS